MCSMRDRMARGEETLPVLAQRCEGQKERGC